MTNDRQQPDALRALVLITTPKLAEKGANLLESGSAALPYRLHAEGTASSEMLELLGLGGSERAVVLAFLPRASARDMLSRLQSALKLAGSSNGIAYTLSLSGASNLLLRILTAPGGAQPAPTIKKDVIHLRDMQYSMILAIVNQGCSDLVMEAARPAGATGGTVISSRFLPNEEATRLWNISVQQEKEIVLILTETEKKRAIMEAIAAQCGAHSPSGGVLASVPVEDLIGV